MPSATGSPSCRPSCAVAATTAVGVSDTCACNSPAPACSAETGGLAQYALLKDYQVATLPDEVSDVEGAVVEPASVAAYGIDRAGVHGGDIVLVTGAGPIGILSAMYADAVGAATVSSRSPTRTAPHWPAPSTSARCSTRPRTASPNASPT